MSHVEFEKKYTEIACRALQLSKKARIEGLLALEDELDKKKINERDILEYGMRFVVDGTDAVLIRDILENILKQEKDNYIRRLKEMQTEAVLSIQSGDNPKFIYYKLNALSGIPYKDDELYKKWKEIS